MKCLGKTACSSASYYLINLTLSEASPLNYGLISISYERQSPLKFFKGKKWYLTWNADATYRQMIYFKILKYCIHQVLKSFTYHAKRAPYHRIIFKHAVWFQAKLEFRFKNSKITIFCNIFFLSLNCRLTSCWLLIYFLVLWSLINLDSPEHFQENLYLNW